MWPFLGSLRTSYMMRPASFLNTVHVVQCQYIIQSQTVNIRSFEKSQRDKNRQTAREFEATKTRQRPQPKEWGENTR
jgi:hypothetical protein